MRRAVARERRISNAADAHRLLLFKVSAHRFRAFHVVVMCLISDELWEMFILSENGHLIHLPRMIEKYHHRHCDTRGGVMSLLSRTIDTSAAISGDDVHVLFSFLSMLGPHTVARFVRRPGAPSWPRAAGARSRTDVFPSNVCTSTA